MANIRKNLFDTSVRTLGLYEKLKKDVEDQSDDILISLPQFLRICLIEKKSGWYNEMNRFDFLVAFNVHSDFPNMSSIGRGLSVCNKIRPYKGKSKSLKEHDFLTLPIIDLQGENFTIQDFVLAIAYHGTFHRKTDKPHLEKLYIDFIQNYPELAFRVALEIGECFIDSFNEMYKKFNGDNDAFSDMHSRQPLIDKTEPAILFSDSYLQLPIRAKNNVGIRICLEIKLKADSMQGFIFSYGHRGKNKIIISCEYNSSFILIKTINKTYTGLNKLIKIPIADYMKQVFFKIEVSLYRSGKFIVAINEWLINSVQLPTSFNIYDGKLIIGADLDGEKNGTFYNLALTVETINKINQINTIFKAATRILGDFPLQDLPSNALRRPNIISAIKF